METCNRVKCEGCLLHEFSSWYHHFSDNKDPEPAFEEVIKQATTNFQEETYYTTVKDQKQISLVIPSRINWYLTSVESFVSDQLLNRQLTFDADSSPEQKKRIFDVQKHEAASGGTGQEINIEVLICRRMYGELKNNLFKVHNTLCGSDRPAGHK